MDAELLRPELIGQRRRFRPQNGPQGRLKPVDQIVKSWDSLKQGDARMWAGGGLGDHRSGDDLSTLSPGRRGLGRTQSSCRDCRH